MNLAIIPILTVVIVRFDILMLKPNKKISQWPSHEAIVISSVFQLYISCI